jgi:8-oxo-dGTP diphosphatase
VESFVEQIRQSKQQERRDTQLSQYETPLVTVDIVVFTLEYNSLKVLLVQRQQAPYEKMWAIPGGFIYVGETLEEAAARWLREKTNVENIYLEQLYAFGDPARDPRARVITVSYYALVRQEKLAFEANDDGVGWFDVHQPPELAFDHQRIVQYALQRLKERLETSGIAFQLLPEKFTLTELQRVYELILHKQLDKRNFRKKMLSSGILREIGETKMEGYHRPAQLYVFHKPSDENGPAPSLNDETSSFL